MTTSQGRIRVSGLNNHGIGLLQQGRHRHANKALLQSLHGLKDSIINNKNTSTSTACIKQEQEDCGFVSQPTDSTRSTSTNNNPEGAEDDCCLVPFDMYQRVFAFAPHHDPTTLHNRDGTSAVILYNLGVNHHLQAQQRQGQSSTCTSFQLTRHALTKALKMYTWALSSVQQWARQYHHDHHPHPLLLGQCHLLRLAILNNMAHTHALLDRPDQAHHCLKCLRDILGHAKLAIWRDDFSFFATNVLLLCLPQHPQQQGQGKDTLTTTTATTSSSSGSAGGWIVAPAAAA